MTRITHNDGHGYTREFDCGCKSVTRGTGLFPTVRWYFCETHQQSTAAAIAKTLGMTPPPEEDTP